MSHDITGKDACKMAEGASSRTKIGTGSKLRFYPAQRVVACLLSLVFAVTDISYAYEIRNADCLRNILPWESGSGMKKVEKRFRKLKPTAESGTVIGKIKNPVLEGAKDDILQRREKNGDDIKIVPEGVMRVKRRPEYEAALVEQMRNEIINEWNSVSGSLGVENYDELLDKTRSGKMVPSLYFNKIFGIEAVKAARDRIIVGRSNFAQGLRKAIAKAAETDVPVLITGKTGTGKELVAQAIHRANGKTGRYVAFNPSAFNENLLSSELFGHVKGAFTGAREDKDGCVSEADGGTLVIDEFGILSQKIQDNLLEFIKYKEIHKVGSTETIPVNARIIALTNEDPSVLLINRKMRRDLYDQFIYTIHLIPLSMRRKDMRWLTEFFVEKYNDFYSEVLNKEIVGVENKLLRYFEDLPWRGNIRELENIIKRLMIFSKSGTLTLDDFINYSNAYENGIHTSRETIDEKMLMFADEVKYYEKHFVLCLPGVEIVIPYSVYKLILSRTNRFFQETCHYLWTAALLKLCKELNISQQKTAILLKTTDAYISRLRKLCMQKEKEFGIKFSESIKINVLDVSDIEDYKSMHLYFKCYITRAILVKTLSDMDPDQANFTVKEAAFRNKSRSPHLARVLKNTVNSETLKREAIMLRRLRELSRYDKLRLMRTTDVILPWQKSVRDFINRVSGVDDNVLITGKPGSGKYFLAEEIHKASMRSKNKLIRVNCAEIDDNLFESAFFGHEKGSFTDAVSKKLGYFEKAEDSIIILTNVEHLSPKVQAKLLRVLQQREFKTVGGRGVKKLNCRVIFISCEDLNKLVQKKKFRKDLLYRINVFEIEVPPLELRKDEIVLLAQEFLKKYSREYGKKIKSFSKSARTCLVNHDWPGNIQELKKIVERAVIYADESVKEITPALFPSEVSMWSDEISKDSKIRDITAKSRKPKSLLKDLPEIKPRETQGHKDTVTRDMV